MSGEQAHLRLAGVTRLSLNGRGPRDAFVFDPHRLAFPCWALALSGATPALLLSFDRHFDLVPHPDVAAVPDASAPLRELDEYARWRLDVRNYDHILAAMEAGIIGDAIIVARARPRGSLEGDEYVDRRGGLHRILRVPNLDRISESFGGAAASSDAGGAQVPNVDRTAESSGSTAASSDSGRAQVPNLDRTAESSGSAPASSDAALAQMLIQAAGTIALDVDLDCFTTPSDADPTEIVPWPRELIRRALIPTGSEAFWEAVFAKARVLTLAREPLHCGGMIASNRVFEDVCAVLLVELLRTDLP